MANGTINKVILIGRIGKDPEARYSPNGVLSINFSLATSEAWKDANGNKQIKTDWHRVKAYGKLAQIMKKYATKGDRIFVEGKLSNYTYKEALSGTMRNVTIVLADKIQLLEKKKGEDTKNDDDGTRGSVEDGDFLPF